MKFVNQFLGLLIFFALAIASNAQDNPCGIEGVVVEASPYLLYSPADIEIEEGETVVWVNVGGLHNVNGVSSTLGQNWDNPETFMITAVSGSSEGVCIGSHTFTIPGTYNYDCSIGNHAEQGMVGTVTVVPAVSNTVVDIIVNSDNHTLLEAAVIQADLAGTLSGDGPFTVFAPTDAAVTALAQTLQITAEELLALPNLADILLYHVVSGQTLSSELSDGQSITTLQGSDVLVTVNQQGVMINDAPVSTPDVMASNGVVHVIDAVLLPPAAPVSTVWDVIANSEDHTILEQAILAVGLDANLANAEALTVFAPTDAAFTEFMEDEDLTIEDILGSEGLLSILLYHAVAGTYLSSDLLDEMLLTSLEGEDIYVNVLDAEVILNESASVVNANLLAENGVVHAIDYVLFPEMEPEATVWDIIEDSESHNYLEAAILAAGLDGALDDDMESYTVFAPIDEAFEALAAALSVTVADLLDLPNLTDILLYHVIDDDYYSDDVTDGMQLTAMNGGTLTAGVGEDFTINGVVVIMEDVEASNGVIHVLEGILLPPSTDVSSYDSAMNWNVFPNPVSNGELTIQVESIPAAVEILNGAGQLVQSHQIAAQTVVISTKSMAPGFYTIRCVQDERVQTKKFLVN